MVIEHLVISGGLIYGLSFYGALRHLIDKDICDIKDIRTIHATSVGSIVATIVALQYEWSIVDEYLIERPWHHVFQFSLTNVINCIDNNGIFGIEQFEEMLFPLLLGKDVSQDITLGEFHEINGISIHFMTINVSTFEQINLSHKTHADWRLIDAVYASCCAPIFFRPFTMSGTVYTDGGFLGNYPIQPLLDEYADATPDNVLGIRLELTPSQDDITTTQWTLYEYLWRLIAKVVRRITPLSNFDFKYQVMINP